MIKNILKLLIIPFIIFGCTSKIGNFSAVSTQNVRGLEYGGKYRDQFKSVSEKSCTHRLYITRTALGFVTFGVAWFMPPFDLVIGDQESDRLTNAVNKAIKAGKDGGVFDADVLVNSTVKQKNIIVPLIYGYKCIIAEGDAVSSILRTEGFLEKKKAD